MGLTADLIEDTIDILDEKGWCKQAYSNGVGQHCVIGAFRKAREARGFYSAVFDATDDSLAKALGFECVTGVMVWNDAISTKKEHVINQLTLVAKNLRDEGQ